MQRNTNNEEKQRRRSPRLREEEEAKQKSCTEKKGRVFGNIGNTSQDSKKENKIQGKEGSKKERTRKIFQPSITNKIEEKEKEDDDSEESVWATYSCTLCCYETPYNYNLQRHCI